MNKLWKVLSYVVVALVAVAITFPFAASVVSDRPNSKLEQVEALITERFIGEADQTHMEDAAAAAMVDSLERLAEITTDYRVFPGHGGSTTLFREQKTNPYMGGYL